MLLASKTTISSIDMHTNFTGTWNDKLGTLKKDKKCIKFSVKISEKLICVQYRFVRFFALLAVTLLLQWLSKNYLTTQLISPYTSFLIATSLQSTGAQTLAKCSYFWRSEITCCLKIVFYAFSHPFLVKFTKIHSILSNFERKNRKNFSNF